MILFELSLYKQREPFIIQHYTLSLSSAAALSLTSERAHFKLGPTYPSPLKTNGIRERTILKAPYSSLEQET